MKKPRFLGCLVFGFLSVLCFFTLHVSSQTSPDVSVMGELKTSLKIPSSLDWSGPDPCNWDHVACENNRVTRIQIPSQSVGGTLPADLKNLSELTIFEVMNNQIGGAIPSLAGLSQLEVANFHTNNFSSFPPDFFTGLTSLTEVVLDYNSFEPWEIPESIKEATSLRTFSANGANIIGPFPTLFDSSTFPSLAELHLAMNKLEGGLPAELGGTMIQSLWVNGQNLNGTIEAIQNMPSLTEVWLHDNQFVGPLPDFSNLTQLANLSVRDNQLTGVVPLSLLNLESLHLVNLTNNKLQGPTPKFGDNVIVDMKPDSNRFCLDKPGVACDEHINVLLSVMEAVGYPENFADNWVGNDPCNDWLGIACAAGKIVFVNFAHMGLTGTISSNFSKLASLTTFVLSSNNLTGTIPMELTTLANLTRLDVSNNRLYGKIPPFRQNIHLVIGGNPDIGKDPVPTPNGRSSGGSSRGGGSSGNGQKKFDTGMVVGLVVGAVGGLSLLVLAICLYTRKRKRVSRVQSPITVVIHPHHSGDQDGVKVTVAGPSVNGGSESFSHTSSAPSDVHMVEAGNMVISIQVLKNVTNNFSEENVLGRGGFGTVYKGELHDGTKIAVKRMESGVVTKKGLTEFKSEITVLTKVRHRHLVALLGYCLEGNERLLVYEYMPQGTLSRHLFNWEDEGLKPLEWMRRLTIALDVARGVEYLHGLAQQSFIHRDIKPSNILLGYDMRAKVADFGLVRLAPVDGKQSIETRLAGTFGYLAPEYAVTGRVTTKVDVFSFGVILMELISGRKALDETQPEESLHLVTWFRRMYVNKNTFRKAIDETIQLDEETLASISTVSELAGHCCAREPYQRPDMSHVVNVLSSLAELWKPAETNNDDIYGIDLELTLPQALKKWQAFEGNSNLDESSSFLASTDSTQTSIPCRPSGFADSFASADAR
ncbi:hypothetical protein GQ457_04G010200 [Hibiscus cannabinus]